MRKNGQLPELLSPAGSPEALRAAIEGGADAVYFGGPSFNARMRAKNFTAEDMREGIALCHAFGVRAYVTLNTLVTDRELPAFLDAAASAREAGADALIVADLGGAAAIRHAFPDLPLHASTQAGAHSAAAARLFGKIGFCRVVLAREATADDMRHFIRTCGVETEVFVHGALCVCHSGQCLFSSMVGGRSGNRGACAQPCRLPDADGRYPLSLKDLSLARHIPALIDMGVDSLKIEGRLKSPEYVRDVTAVFRRLLDERRAATDKEMKYLADIFSRGGFTDGYFAGRIDRHMLGTRSEADKQTSAGQAPFTGLTRSVPLTLDFVMEPNEPVRLTLTANGKTCTVAGDIPLAARTAPMSADDVKKNLCRFGGTPYRVEQTRVTVGEGLLLPLSRLNALRRAALAGLADNGRPAAAPVLLPVLPTGKRPDFRTARFETAAQITKTAEKYFVHRYLPLDRYDPAADGVVVPPVIFDSEASAIAAQLKKVAAAGARHALIGNPGHIDPARAAGLIPHGDFRLNITNEHTLSLYLSLGLADALLSPELTLPQIRDVKGAADIIVYGRLPLMLLEKCLGKEVGTCDACAAGANVYTDRRGEKFPVLRLSPHRNILVNSRPTVMSDKRRELADAHVTGGHFFFTVETPEEVDAVIAAYQNGDAPTLPVRRI